MEMALTRLMIALQNTSFLPPEYILPNYFVFVYKQPEKERESLPTLYLASQAFFVL